jgi:hypothetical protein
MWGNDPLAPDPGDKITQSWINPKADRLRIKLNGTRTSWGYQGRMNGPGRSILWSYVSHIDFQSS